MKNLFKNLGLTAGVSLLFVPIGAFVGAFFVLLSLSMVFAGSAGNLFSTLPLTQFDVLHATVLKRTDERANVTYFLSSFFKVENTESINVVVNTKAHNKNVAVDINYHTDGVLHKRQLNSGQLLQIPQYVKYTNLTESDLYNGIAFNPAATTAEIFNFGKIIADDLHDIADQMDRARELQCAKVLSNGIVTFNVNDSINYGRLVGSMVTASTPWTAIAGDPLADLAAGVSWIRTNTNNTSGVFNVIMGSAALSAFLANDEVLKLLNNRRVEIGSIAPRQAEASGGNYIGEFLTQTGHRIRVWGYDGEYTDAGGNTVKYVDKNNAIIIPENNELTMAVSKKRMLPNTPGAGVFRGKTKWEIMDYKRQVHEYHLADLFLAIPQQVNDIYTLKATNVA